MAKPIISYEELITKMQSDMAELSGEDLAELAGYMGIEVSLWNCETEYGSDSLFIVKDEKPRFMTAYFLEEDVIKAYTEDENWKEAQENAEEWIWQFADDKPTAILQHYDKHDLWKKDYTQFLLRHPNQETY